MEYKRAGDTSLSPPNHNISYRTHDQYVISYNFQTGQNSQNVTRNLLIGVSHEQPNRKKNNKKGSLNVFRYDPRTWKPENSRVGHLANLDSSPIGTSTFYVGNSRNNFVQDKGKGRKRIQMQESSSDKVDLEKMRGDGFYNSEDIKLKREKRQESNTGYQYQEGASSSINRLKRDQGQNYSSIKSKQRSEGHIVNQGQLAKGWFSRIAANQSKQNKQLGQNEFDERFERNEGGLIANNRNGADGRGPMRTKMRVIDNQMGDIDKNSSSQAKWRKDQKIRRIQNNYQQEQKDTQESNQIDEFSYQSSYFNPNDLKGKNGETIILPNSRQSKDNFLNHERQVNGRISRPRNSNATINEETTSEKQNQSQKQNKRDILKVYEEGENTRQFQQVTGNTIKNIMENKSKRLEQIDQQMQRQNQQKRQDLQMNKKNRKSIKIQDLEDEEEELSNNKIDGRSSAEFQNDDRNNPLNEAKLKGGQQYFGKHYLRENLTNRGQKIQPRNSIDREDKGEQKDKQTISRQADIQKDKKLKQSTYKRNFNPLEQQKLQNQFNSTVNQKKQQLRKNSGVGSEPVFNNQPERAEKRQSLRYGKSGKTRQSQFLPFLENKQPKNQNSSSKLTSTLPKRDSSYIEQPNNFQKKVDNIQQKPIIPRQRNQKQKSGDQLKQLEDMIRRQEGDKIKKSHFKSSEGQERKEIIPSEASKIFSKAQIQRATDNQKIKHPEKDINTQKKRIAEQRSNQKFNGSVPIKKFGSVDQRGFLNNPTNTKNQSHNKARQPHGKNQQLESPKNSTNSLNKNNNNQQRQSSMAEREKRTGDKPDQVIEVVKGQKEKSFLSAADKNGRKESKIRKPNIVENKVSQNKIEDLSLNNQIKGFKIPESVINKKTPAPGASKINSESLNDNSRNKKKEDSSRTVENPNKKASLTKQISKNTLASNPKDRNSTTRRQKSLQDQAKSLNKGQNSQSRDKSFKLTPKDKERNLKNWKQAQKTQSQRLKNENKSAKDKNYNNKNWKQSSRVGKTRRQPNRKTGEFNIDGQQEDKFGVLSSNSRKIKGNSKSRGKWSRQSKLRNTTKSQKYPQISQQQSDEQRGSKQNIDRKLNYTEQMQEQKEENSISHISSIKSMDCQQEKIIFVQPTFQINQPQEMQPTQFPHSQHSKIHQNQVKKIKENEEKGLQYLLMEGDSPKKNANIQETPVEVNQFKKSTNDEQINAKVEKFVGCNIFESNPKQANVETLTDAYDRQQQIDVVGQMRQASPDKQIQKILNQTATNKSQDFFMQNIKDHTKMTETFNISFNKTKVDKNRNNYQRAPILSFLYELPMSHSEEANKFLPSLNSCDIFDQIGPQQIPVSSNQIIQQALSMLISFDLWVVERIFQPYYDLNGKVGIWLYCMGVWRIFLIQIPHIKPFSYKQLLQQAILEAKMRYFEKQLDLQDVLKLVFGVKAMKVKGNSKRVFQQLEYSLKKGHILKAFSKQQSKFKIRSFDVLKLQRTVKHENVIQITSRNTGEAYWIKEQKFNQIFDYFLLIGNRPSLFWTSKIIPANPEHRAVVKVHSSHNAQGSVTLYYQSKEPSNLYLYKEVENRVLKFMGKIVGRQNKNGNLYFDFNIKGSYYLFMECPMVCNLSIEGSSKIGLELSEYVGSSTLKNNECEYVEVNRKQQRRKGDGLGAFRQRFIDYVIKR